MMVQVHKGSNSAGGVFIHETFITGNIIKFNAKSIRVHMFHIKYLTNGELTRENSMNETATFSFWKSSADGTTSIYKNPKYGIIKVLR
jgi:hypothetical protein